MGEASQTEKAGGLATWFYIMTPGLQTVAFTGSPSPLGVNSRAVNSVNEIACYITPTGEPKRTNESITVSEPTA